MLNQNSEISQPFPDVNGFVHASLSKASKSLSAAKVNCEEVASILETAGEGVKTSNPILHEESELIIAKRTIPELFQNTTNTDLSPDNNINCNISSVNHQNNNVIDKDLRPQCSNTNILNHVCTSNISSNDHSSHNEKIDSRVDSPTADSMSNSNCSSFPKTLASFTHLLFNNTVLSNQLFGTNSSISNGLDSTGETYEFKSLENQVKSQTASTINVFDITSETCVDNNAYYKDEKSIMASNLAKSSDIENVESKDNKSQEATLSFPIDEFVSSNASNISNSSEIQHENEPKLSLEITNGYICDELKNYDLEKLDIIKNLAITNEKKFKCKEDNETHSKNVCHSKISENTDINHVLESFPNEFTRIVSENIIKSGEITNGWIYLTDYRILFSFEDTSKKLSLPICLIDELIIRDSFFLCIHTKQVRSVICAFKKVGDCFRWWTIITELLAKSSKWEHLFSFQFYKALNHANQNMNNEIINTTKSCENDAEKFKQTESLIEKEFKRLNFGNESVDGLKLWKISKANENFQLCPSYPRYLIVPEQIKDEDLEYVATFRYYRRLPAIVWRSLENGCVIARSSQPEVGLWGSSRLDQELLKSIVDNSMREEDGSNGTKLLVLDARSYTAAFVNRAKGGGYECAESYSRCETQFMGLANIHSIRSSFSAIRAACEFPTNEKNLNKLFSSSKWYNYVSDLIRCAMVIVNAIQSKRSVLVHCSDGWDRTPQLVSLAELILDPYYRTLDGFKVLVEKEWLEFGHKFADRCGNGYNCDDPYERCPVFLQWLDCIHQIVIQYEEYFEFNIHYLETLLLHTYSCLFGTFLCNNVAERIEKNVYKDTLSVWSYISSSKDHFKNQNYCKDLKNLVLEPSFKLEDMQPWVEVFVPLINDELVVGNLYPEEYLISLS